VKIQISSGCACEGCRLLPPICSSSILFEFMMHSGEPHCFYQTIRWLSELTSREAEATATSSDSDGDWTHGLFRL
jgi:hypothetical protein